jgi:hypothetical protein
VSFEVSERELSAAVPAIKVKGVLSGKRIEQPEIGTPSEFEQPP